MKIVINAISSVLGFGLYWALGDSFEVRISVATAMLIVLLPCALIGYVIGSVTSRRVNLDGIGAEIFSWSTLVLWIFPPMGIIGGAIVSSWAKHATHSVKFTLVSSVAFLAAMINLAIGARAGVLASLCAQSAAYC